MTGGVALEVEQHPLVEVQEQGRCRLGRPGVDAGEQVEGALGVGEDPDRAGAAHLERVVVAQTLQRAGAAGDGRVERRGVGGVEAHRDVGRGRRVSR